MTDTSASRGRELTYVALAVAVMLPGLTLRGASIHTQHWLAATLFGLAIVGAAFLLSWAAEVLQLDVSQGMTLAIVALIAVLPEYAVDFVFAYKAGKDPSQSQFALANMTGANRLLIGVGWSLVVLVAAWRLRSISREKGYKGPIDTDIALDRSRSVEISFLVLATIYSLTLPFKHTLTLVDAAVLVIIFIAYIARISRGVAESPDLVGPALLIGNLPKAKRRIAVATVFLLSAGVIVACAEPFAESLVATGESLKISTFFLVQWLAPLASETPELLVAALFAWKLNTDAGLGTLVSSKVNQWTLLVGSLPLVFAVSSGALHGLPLDALQRQELFLTAAQSAFAVAVLANLRLSIKEALMLFGLFASQFVLGAVLDLTNAPVHLQAIERVGIGVIYLVLAAVIIVRNRKAVVQLLRDGLRTPMRELALSDQSSGLEPNLLTDH